MPLSRGFTTEKGNTVNKTRFTAEQILSVLKQATAGTPVVEVVRRSGISEHTFYRWKKLYMGAEMGHAAQIRQFENNRLKRLVADLMLDKKMLQDVLARILEARQRRSHCHDALESKWNRTRKSAGCTSVYRQSSERMLIQ